MNGGPGRSSASIAAFVTGFSRADAPAPVKDLAQTAFVDTVGVMLAGSREPASEKVRAMVLADNAASAATLVGTDARASAPAAAMVNGTATQALDFDLSFMIGQSSAALVPALLAVAETRSAAPSEAIDAWIVGMEVCGALAAAMPTLSSEGGWHGAGLLGTLSATAALARLCGLGAEQTTAAIGIAASMASGISANFGTMTKPLHTGLAARNAVDAVALARSGFTGSPAALDGQAGFLDCFGRGLQCEVGQIESLGRTWRLIERGFKVKPFGCGGLLHCAIEAALEIRAASSRPADSIRNVTIGVSPHAFGRAIDAYPASEDESRFALRYLIAWALLRGAPTTATFTESGYDDDAVRELWQRTETVVGPDFAGLRGSNYSPGHVTVTLADGTRREAVVSRPAGSPEKPMPVTRLRAKFAGCAAPVLGAARAEELFAFLSTLDGHASLDPLWPMLAAQDRTGG